MFYDRAKIYVKGGDGGNGVVSFRREKYVPEGGPNGGDGGHGGNVIFQVDSGLRTLVDFRYSKHYKADRGQHGQGKNMHGRGAKDMVVNVPPGTVIKDEETGQVMGDLVESGQSMVVAQGGRGGRGNARFVSSKNRVPTFAEKGEPGEERQLILELKLLADVGLIGFPNVGKSTMISRISAAKPKIADYPFTTLVPNLGVVRLDEGRSFVVADIPGLVEGAHEGTGLGHRFLRHVERTRLLLHVLDGAQTEGRDIIEDYQIINRELAHYNEALSRRHQIVVVNKMDIPGSEENIHRLKDCLEPDIPIVAVSAVTGDGIDKLLLLTAELLEKIEAEPMETLETEEVRIVEGPTGQRFTIDFIDGVWVVGGNEIEKHLAMTDFNNEDSVKRLQHIMRVMGVEGALRKKGAASGEEVRIKDIEFEFMD
ncbi:GTPase ObgE [Metallumcola ferriviriculae]|uniref:GTPase Obg n=1 Tax=Metallumcola ferriviriculae TaxID=3039180 RepID=A0AAU0UM11_9FIRM|nr:GTPase ObgE [Desulfitibacteraceae bacterium MK1]